MKIVSYKVTWLMRAIEIKKETVARYNVHIVLSYE
jgi:hypothetical protein